MPNRSGGCPCFQPFWHHRSAKSLPATRALPGLAFEASALQPFAPTLTHDEAPLEETPDDAQRTALTDFASCYDV